MGNCLISGMGDGPNKSSPIRVTTSNGGIMEFDSPVTVESITDEFPGHGIFRSHDLFLNPLPHTELLLPGESYHLLLLAADRHVSNVVADTTRARHSRSSSAPPQQLASNSGTTPYRMSFDSRGMKRKILSIWDDSNVANKCGDGNNERMVSRKFDDGYCKSSSHGGFWKVKLVISPEQLMEILSEEGKTEELIESVRTVAKCGSNVGGGGGGYCSDQWSRSSSRNAASSTNQD